MVVKTKHEEKLEALEEEAPDALEMAAQKDEEGKTKKDTALKVSVTSRNFSFFRAGKKLVPL